MDLQTSLTEIPEGLRRPLIALYEEALAEHRAGKWEAVGVKTGKICEIVYCIVAGAVDGKFPPAATKPANMVDACRALEKSNKIHGRPICIQIPKVLIAAYELRNNRAIGHIAIDVSPNHMDAEFLMRSVQWLIAELVRLFAKVSSDQAQMIVDSVTERRFHAVWVDGDERRVLNGKLNPRDRVLVLLYSAGNAASIAQLRQWCEYKNSTQFKTLVLRRLSDLAMIHCSGEKVMLLPPGMLEVERRSLLALEK